MIDSAKFEKIDALTENNEMLDKLVACTSADAFAKVLAEANIECTEEEVEEMYSGMAQARDKEQSGELGEDDLENVNGGMGLVAAACFIGGAYVAGRIGGYIWAKKVKRYL